MIRIYTFADKRPDFIPMQEYCISEFINSADPRESTTYTVFNNGSSDELRQQIKHSCTKNIIHYPLPEEAMDHSNPNSACAVPLNWAWKNVICKQHRPFHDISIVLDSDMFPVAPIDILKYMASGSIIMPDIAGTYQRRGKAKYIWNGIMFFTMCDGELDFSYGEVAGSITDVGGKTHEWFEKYGRALVKNIHHTSHIHPDNNNMHCIPESLRSAYDPEFRMEIYADCFLHYGRGSNWDGMPADYHIRKTAFLERAILEASDHPTLLFKPHGYIFSQNEWQ